MNGLDTWFKFHTNLLTKSRKFVTLPDNDHRWLFTALMAACKLGWITEQCGLLPNATPMLLSIAGMNHRKFKRVSKGLMDCQLVAANLWVIGFEESQLTPDAFRKRRQRSQESPRTDTGTCPVTSHGDSRKQKAEKKPPKPPKGGKADPRVEEVSLQVIAALNEAHGLARTPNKSVRHAVGLCLKEGHSPEDILAVAKHRLTEDWFHPRKFGAESLIRLKAFESALERAKEAKQDDGYFKY